MPRRAGYRTSDETRDKIKAGVIIQRLMTHIESATPTMDASQVNAAKTLLNKVLPDLKAIELTGPEGGPVQSVDMSKLTEEQLIALASVRIINQAK
jgi:hypothetical protein